MHLGKSLLNGDVLCTLKMIKGRMSNCLCILSYFQGIISDVVKDSG